MNETGKPVQGLIFTLLVTLLVGVLFIIAAVLVVGTLAALAAVAYKIFLFTLSL